MAICKICGKENTDLPQEWINWECEICFGELMQSSIGCYSPEERKFCNPHASFPGSLEEIDAPLLNNYSYSPAEIVEALESQICPRCQENMDINIAGKIGFCDSCEIGFDLSDYTNDLAYYP